MKEIDLKVTPLSKIDLSKIDYEKSYVNNHKRVEQIEKITYHDLSETFCVYTEGDLVAGYTFHNRGHVVSQHITLHLFYKEVRECKTCKHSVVLPHNAPCNGCLNESRTECTHINWQPKESVSIGGGWYVKDSSNPHDIVIKYENHGDKVKIVSIEGVMTLDEITNHTGIDLCSEYVGFAKYAYMYKLQDEDINYVAVNCVTSGYLRILKIGENYSKNSFFDAVDNMKLSAKRLAQLIKDSKKPAIKEIRI